MTVPETSQRVIAAGRERGVTVDMHVFPDGTKTSQDAAAAVGCELSAIAKSIVLTLDDREQIVVFASGDTRIDMVRIAVAAGAQKARRATLEEARAATGFAAGGTPPFGYPSPLRCLPTSPYDATKTSGQQEERQPPCSRSRSPSW